LQPVLAEMSRRLGYGLTHGFPCNKIAHLGAIVAAGTAPERENLHTFKLNLKILQVGAFASGHVGN
jgi:hypothetical protein